MWLPVQALHVGRSGSQLTNGPGLSGRCNPIARPESAAQLKKLVIAPAAAQLFPFFFDTINHSTRLAAKSEEGTQFVLTYHLAVCIGECSVRQSIRVCRRAPVPRHRPDQAGGQTVVLTRKSQIRNRARSIPAGDPSFDTRFRLRERSAGSLPAGAVRLPLQDAAWSEGSR